MAQALIRRLRDETLDDYRAQARELGTSVEAYLRDLIEANRPLRKKDPKKLRRLSDEALAMTPPNGPGEGSDSTFDIRWDRDTNHGTWIDDGWGGNGAGR